MQVNRWTYAPDLRGRALHFAKAYDRLLREADELAVQSPVMDGQPRGTNKGDPVFAAVIRRERIKSELAIIDGALLDIEPEYRAGVIDNVCRGVPMKNIAGVSERTLARKRRTFLAGIVARAGWAENDLDGWHQF